MRYVLVALMILGSQANSPKQPVVEDSKNTNERQAPKKAIPNKLPEKSTVSGPGREPNTEAQETAHQTKPDGRAYKVEVVSEPSQPTDPWIIASVGVTGLATLAACVGPFHSLAADSGNHASGRCHHK